MPLKTHQDEQPTLNLTPMIDIVFLLIIFFMVGTKFTELERNLHLEVPQVSEADATAETASPRIVNIFRDGSITLDRQSVTVSQLADELRSSLHHQPHLGVIVRGDAEGPFQNVANVLSACRQAGVRDMAVSVKLNNRAR